MKVRIKQAVSKTAPDLHGRGVDFQAGEEVDVRYICYPPEYSEWSFWQSSDIDLSLIFTPKDIDALILTPQEQEQLSEVPLDSVPVEVIVRD